MAGLWFSGLLIAAIMRKQRGAAILMTAYLILFSTIIHDILVFHGIIPTPFLLDAGTAVYALMQILLHSSLISHNLEEGDHSPGNLQKGNHILIKKLEAEIKEMKHRSEQKILFFINFAHEIKTPLTIIQNSLNEYLKKANITEELKIVKENINKLCRDIMNLLDIRKIEEAALPYNEDTIIDATKTLERILDQFKAVARFNRIQLTFSGKDSLYLQIDPYAFERIINNIVDNAIKYTKENGHVDVHMSADQDNVIIMVKDDGIGISEDQQKDIFLPYYQVSQTNQNIHGLGLGLYIVKNILTAFKSSIEIKSRLNKGTTVSLIFPRHAGGEIQHRKDYIPRQPVDEPVEPKLREKAYDNDKPTVFIVEDNTKLISFMQKSMGTYFNILYATDGKEGLKKLHTIPKPDIIISDIMMETMDGHEFYNNLMTIERLRDIPFIFLTARTGREEKIKSLKKGVIDYIYKPFDKEELIEKVKSILKNRQAHTESEIRKMEKRLSSLLRTSGDDEFLSFEKKCKMYTISPREKEVLRDLLKGKQIKEIAGKLYLSVHTVRNHIRHIYNKCKVQNRVELINLFSKD